MKFSDGCWLTQKGFNLHSPVSISRISEKEDSVTLLTPCRKVRDRGDTLLGPNLEISFSSPLKDVLKIRIEHFRGKQNKGPFFDVAADRRDLLKWKEGGESFSFTSGSLKAIVSKEDYAVEFSYSDRYLTGSSFRDAAWVEGDSGTNYVKEELKISVGENIYGLGERFTPFIKNGQTIDIWNRDGGTGSEQAYKNIPFYVTNKGYGVFVNHPEMVRFEVGSEKVSRVQFSVEGEYLEYYLIGGESLKEVLNNYTDLTGKGTMPPAWSFGLWLTTSFTTSYDEETTTSFINGMKERDIPLDVFHFDCFWMKEYNWCDFTWDKDVFPDPEGMLKRYKDKGLKISAWINPYVGQASPLFDEGCAKEYFIKCPNGDVWQWDLWQPGMAIIDFTNPEACRWFQDKLRPLLEMGVDSLKTDFGERIPVDVVYHDGSDPVKMHNYYTYLYNKTVFELVEDFKGKNKAVLFARSATVGGQRFPIHWGGDSTSDFESMAESLRGGLSLGLGGFTFWSHDMGGFEQTSTADVYMRWVAFGLFSSHSRLHGSQSYRVPWLYSDEAVDVVRFFTKQKNRLMPYIMDQSVRSVQAGLPVMRAMVLEFPDDPVCATLDRQYMFGSEILVAPVFDPSGEVTYYLPAGKWTHLISGEKKEGGRYYTQKFDYFSLPVFVREGALIPWGNCEDNAEYDYSEKIDFCLYGKERGDGSYSFLLNESGSRKVSVMISRKENGIDFSLTGDGSGVLKEI